MSKFLTVKIRPFGSCFVNTSVSFDSIYGALDDPFARAKWKGATDSDRRLTFQCLQYLFKDGCTKDQLNKFVMSMR